MPAETHQHSDPPTASAVLDLIGAVLIGSDGSDLDGDLPLAGLGIDSDPVLLDLFDAVREEYGERTLGDVDLDELRGAATLGELAGVLARSCSVEGTR